MKKREIIFLTWVTTLFYFIWRIGWTLPIHSGGIDMLFAILLLLAEGIGFGLACHTWWCAMHAHEIEAPDISKNDYPDVDDFITLKTQNPKLLNKTINGCLHMEYPDPNKVHIYLCDTSHDPQIAEMAHHRGIGYFKCEATHSVKAHSLNLALVQTNSPLIAVFDDDRIPMHDFLMSVVPYFFLDRYQKNGAGQWSLAEKISKQIGFVQTPLNFYNNDLIKFNLFTDKGQPNEQDSFSHYIASTKNYGNAAVFLGTDAILSRAALKKINGFNEETLTGAMATGLLMQTNGYQTYAINKIHANGLATADMGTFFKEKAEDAVGYIQDIQKLKRATEKKMTFSQRLSYFCALLSCYTPIRYMIYLLSPLLYILFGIQLFQCTYRGAIFLALPHFIFYALSLSVLYGEYKSLRWSNIYDTILSLPLVPSILLESLHIRKKSTPIEKQKTEAYKTSKKWCFQYALPYILIFILSLVGLFNTLFSVLLTPLSAIMMVWLCYNLYNLFMAVCFILGRRSHRENERLMIELPIQVIGENRTQEAYTHDISDGGLSFAFDTPQYIPKSDLFQIILSDENKRYTAHLLGELVHVREDNGKWYYSVAFKNMQEKDDALLQQIIYDRIPVWQYAHPSHGNFYKEMENTVANRRKPDSPSRRKLPRVKVRRKFSTLEGDTVFVQEFNYEYLLVTHTKNIYNKSLTLRDKDSINIVFDCTLEKLIYDKDNIKVAFGLYRIDNAKDYMSNSEFEKTLSDWAVEARKDFDQEVKEQRIHRQKRLTSTNDNSDYLKNSQNLYSK